MSESKSGVRAAIRKQAGERSLEIADAADRQFLDWRQGQGGQTSLLPALLDEEPTADGVEILDQEPEDPGAGRGVGRPKGARNKRTQHTLDYLQGMGYEDPLRGLAETWSRPPAVLAAQLGVSKAEAFVLQQEARKIALPFWHQKLPQAIVIDDRAAMTVVQVNAAEMLELLMGRDDEMSRRGIELLAPLLELTAEETGDGETDGNEE